MAISGCKICDDGNLCAYDNETISKPDPASTFDRLFCGSEGFGIMYHLSGRDDLARYSDRAAYDGTRLPPAPTTCPSTPGLELCGGACGACPAKFTCLGRSPLHPYSLCAFLGWQDTSNGVRCTRGSNAMCDGLTPGKYKCFVWKVDPASQPIADQNGVCIAADQCAAAGQLYPGGGFCTP
ncbi:hypothetical protein BH09MYX1_BH09MYX1_01920 [soil metagenome]